MEGLERKLNEFPFLWGIQQEWYAPIVDIQVQYPEDQFFLDLGPDEDRASDLHVWMLQDRGLGEQRLISVNLQGYSNLAHALSHHGNRQEVCRFVVTSVFAKFPDPWTGSVPLPGRKITIFRPKFPDATMHDFIDRIMGPAKEI